MIEEQQSEAKTNVVNKTITPKSKAIKSKNAMSNTVTRKLRDSSVTPGSDRSLTSHNKKLLREASSSNSRALRKSANITGLNHVKIEVEKHRSPELGTGTLKLNATEI